MARFNNMAFVTIAGKRQVRVNVSGKSMFFFDVPANANHVAIDCCGEVWAFACNPSQNLQRKTWMSNSGRNSHIGNVGFINNWKEAYIGVSSAAKEFDAFQSKINRGMATARIGNGFITDDILRYGVEFKADRKDSGQCKIEDMPVAAKVMAVKDAYENWVDFYYVSNRMEIHDDIITLLNKQSGFTAEVSFKRGTMVKWEK